MGNSPNTPNTTRRGSGGLNKSGGIGRSSGFLKDTESSNGDKEDSFVLRSLAKGGAKGSCLLFFHLEVLFLY